HADGPVVLEDLFGLIGKLTQLCRISASEACLNAPAAAGAQQKFFSDGVGVRIFFIQMLLDARHQPVDFFVVVDVDQELNEGTVLAFRSVNKHETQAASTDKRSDMGDVWLSLDILLNLARERLRFSDIDAAGQEGVNHELRPCRWREK